MIPGSPIPVERSRRTYAHPYVVRTPPFARQSAGIRVLHWLCDALNHLGAEAWVSVDAARGPLGADPAAGLAAGLATPVLDKATQAAWQRQGRKPIVILPESFDDPPDPGAVNVRYALNYLGVMGTAKLPQCDMTVAYAENILRATPGCDDVLFIPGSDPRWWTPSPIRPQRRGALVYAGKYVDHHRQRLPLHLRDATMIPRHGPEAPTTEALREMLRGAKRLYVFENTAVAAEAVLCGCPVIACRNWFFRELIAEHELGLDGFAFDDSPTALAEAVAGVAAFRVRYARTMQTTSVGLRRFVDATQALASGDASYRREDLRDTDKAGAYPSA